MEGTYALAGLVGLVLPFIVSYLKNKNWSAKVKQGVAIAASVAAALGVSVVDNGIDVANWDLFVANLGIIFSVSQVFYKQYFGATRANVALENTGVGKGGA